MNTVGQNPDYSFKVIIVGDSNVGKTVLMKRFIRGEYAGTEKPTIGLDMGHKRVIHGTSLVNLQFWDTAGQERYRTITSAYYRCSNGALIVFALDDIRSFENVTIWAREMKKNLHGASIPVILVGNKSDLTRVIADDSIFTLIDELKSNRVDVVTYIETSVLNGANVDEVFNNLTRVMCQKFDENIKKTTQGDVIGGDKIEITKTKNNTTSCAC